LELQLKTTGYPLIATRGPLPAQASLVECSASPDARRTDLDVGKRVA
jgi:hypothetical protein